METASTEVTSIWRQNDIEKSTWRTRRYFVNFEILIHVEIFGSNRHHNLHKDSPFKVDVILTNFLCGALTSNRQRCVHWTINLNWPVISNFPFICNRIGYINHWCQSLSPYPALVISSLSMLLQWRFTWRQLVSFKLTTFCTVHLILDSIKMMVFLVAVKSTYILLW